MGIEMQNKEKLIGEGVSFERIHRITGYLGAPRPCQRHEESGGAR